MVLLIQAPWATSRTGDKRLLGLSNRMVNTRLKSYGTSQGSERDKGHPSFAPMHLLSEAAQRRLHC